MKKKAYSVYLTDSARAYVQRRIDDESHPYRGFSDYVEAAIFYDLIAGLPHPLLSDLMGRPEWSRKKLFEELLEKAAEGDLPEGWVKDRIQALVSDEVKKKCQLCRHKPAN